MGARHIVGLDIGTTKVCAVVAGVGSGGYEILGTGIAPARGMKGASWTGREMCWRHAPKEYAAIHFHDDDLHDCGWETDFSFTVPPDLKSGVYAMRLGGGEAEDMIPFFVEENPYARGIVPTIRRLGTAVRDASGTVAWVVPGPPSIDRTEFLGPERSEAVEALRGRHFDHRWQLAEALVEASGTWRAKDPGPLTREYNKRLAGAYDYLYRYLHVEGG